VYVIGLLREDEASFVIVLASLLDRNFDRPLWISGLVFVAAVAGAKKRTTPCVTALFFGAVRFGLAALTNGQPLLFLAAEVLAVTAVLLFRLGSPGVFHQ
jgi:hypothetical protein